MFSLLCYIIIGFLLFFSVWTKYRTYVPIFGASQVMVVVKNIPANAGHIRRLRFDPRWGASLQEGTAAYPSILAWPILWTEEPVGLQSVGLQRVGHNWSYLECMHAPIFNHLISCLPGKVGKKKKGQSKWRMKENLVSKKNCMNLIETFSTAFY